MSEKKALFISSMAVGSVTSGGSQCSKRNLKSIVDLFGEANVTSYFFKSFNIHNVNLQNIVGALANTICLRINGLTKEAEKEIINTIQINEINWIFVDSSLNGRLIKLIKKKTKAKVISFFHNCELSLISQEIFTGKIMLLPRIYSSYFNEKLTVKYSDKIIALNNRDKVLIKKYYKRNVDIIIPISIEDKFTKHIPEKILRSSEIKKVLFVGSYFYPNIDGIKWFIRNVLPHVNIILTIIGKDMDKLTDIDFNKKNIEVLSNVPQIEKYYYNADIVIAPIFKGSGMKVKIAEAMMYGKPIIGTDEAFQGYDIVDGMYKANTIKEFITAINKENTYYENEIRNNFLQKYSYESTLPLFSKCFSEN